MAMMEKMVNPSLMDLADEDELIKNAVPQLLMKVFLRKQRSETKNHDA